MESLLDSAVEQKQETLRGTITRIIWQQGARCILKIKLDAESRDKPNGKKRKWEMSALGTMVDPHIGQLYEFTGECGFNPHYGSEEIRFTAYRSVMPDDTIGIINYLSTSARWVGPAVARALVDAFGKETLDVIKSDPRRVEAAGIKGLDADKIAEISECLNRSEQTEAATLECINLLGGVLTPRQIAKAVAKWGCDAASKIKENPFILTELHGVGFISADAVHKGMGGGMKDVQRHRAGLCHVLAEAIASEGHTAVSLLAARTDSEKLLGVEVDETVFADDRLVVRPDCLTLKRIAENEEYVAQHIKSMLAMPIEDSRLYPAIPTDGLADDQIAAVLKAECQPIFILTGAPGTGKTYTTARIITALHRSGLTVFMAAPTGKAAKQMSNALASCGSGQATTIHTLLQPAIDEETGDFRFGKNETDPLEADVVVIDEFSMVDVNLCASLLRAIPLASRLIIVGDHYQLPSVGPGAVLRDLLDAGVPAWELKEIKRNAGTIVRACHAIKDGRTPTPDAKLNIETGANWRHIECPDDEIVEVIEALYTGKLPPDLDRVWDVQLISPTNEKGRCSCAVLNKLAKGLLNPGETEGRMMFGVGDKVVRLKNALVRGWAVEDQSMMENCPKAKVRVVNGDLGIVEEIDKLIRVRFRYPDRVALLARGEHELKPAYCLTCHKMQGSEVPVVILPLSKTFAGMPMVNREWLYTAMSRAKRFIVTVGDLGVMERIIGKVGNRARVTRLMGLMR